MSHEVNVDDNVFEFNEALIWQNDNEDHEPKLVKEQRDDWPKIKRYSRKMKLISLANYQNFGPVVQTPEGVKLASYRMIFEMRQKTF